MMDYERDLCEEYPDKAIDLIVEILKIENNRLMLSLLAATVLLEDVISMEIIDRIEREASANKRFRTICSAASRWIIARPMSLARQRRGCAGGARTAVEKPLEVCWMRLHKTHRNSGFNPPPCLRSIHD